MGVVRLSGVVMAHPRRLVAAEGLVRAHPELGLRVVTDPEPGGVAGALRTARVAWGAVAEGATHHLVVQDDMVLAPGVASHVSAAAAAFPEAVLCFFTEWGSRTSHAVRLAVMEGASWVPVLDPYVPSAMVLLPAGVARELAAYAGDGVPDDVLLLRFVRERGLTALVSAPNLAEHAVSPSLVGNDIIMGPRRSVLFGDARLDLGVWPGAAVPHLLIFEGKSMCHVRDDGWRAVLTSDYLGIEVGRLLDWYRSAARVAGSAGGIVAEPILFQYWLTVLAYGVVARVPPTRAGLRTLAPGALRRFVPSSYLDRLPDLVGAVTDHALGLAAGIDNKLLNKS